jgi:hypothetical protein
MPAAKRELMSDEKRSVGAPVKYTDEVPSRLLKFFDREPFQEIDGKKMPAFLPTVERFTFEIGIAVSTFYEWVKKYPELSKAFEVAKALQKNQLMQLSLLGFYKEGFAKFVAVNITDMRDKQDVSVEDVTVTLKDHRKDNDN